MTSIPMKSLSTTYEWILLVENHLFHIRGNYGVAYASVTANCFETHFISRDDRGSDQTDETVDDIVFDFPFNLSDCISPQTTPTLRLQNFKKEA